jgi:hypothetical protein
MPKSPQFPSLAALDQDELRDLIDRILKLGRLRLRGPWGAQDEFTLAAIAQNLRRLAKLAAQPPPIATACVG